jgi:integrase
VNGCSPGRTCHRTRFGRTQLAAIEPRHIKAYAAELGKRGLSPASVRNLLAPLRALFATAFEEGVIRSNPTAGVRITRPQHYQDGEEAKAKALSEDELVRLLDELPAEWRLLFEFMVHTGLRIGETIALRWGDVDLGRRRVKVTRRLYRGRFAPPKSKYGLREVPLTHGMAQALWPLHAGKDDDDLVFPSTAGTPLEPSNLAERIFKPAARAAGVPWASFHTLRHTCASLLFTKAGLNAKHVQAWLGHHSPAFTLATYVHLMPDDLPDASALDALTHGSTEGTTRHPETGRDAVAVGAAG